MDNEYDLPEILASIWLSDEDDIENITVDDFYDFVGINYEDRSDFVTSILVDQASSLLLNSHIGNGNVA